MKVMIADDEYIIRNGITAAISRIDSSFEIIAEAADGFDAMEKALQLQPDIIFADINMPKCDGLEFIKNLRNIKNYTPEIIILTGFREFDYVQRALELGATAFLLKPVNKKLLAETLNKSRDAILEKRKIKNIVSDYNAELPYLKNSFLVKLLTGSLMEENEVKKQFEYYNISEKKYFLTVCIQSTRFNHSLIKNEYIDISGCNSYFCYINSSETCLLYFFDTDTREKLYTSLEILSKKLYTKTNSIPKIGISGFYSGMNHFSTAYYESLETAAFACETNNIKFYDAVKYTASNKRDIQEALNIIARDFHKNLTIDKVADELKISPSHLMHTFKQEIGKTFNGYLTEYRMKIACEMLKAQEFKIYEIAERLGYKSTKHFSKLFKKSTGYSPSEYLNNLKDDN